MYAPADGIKAAAKMDWGLGTSPGSSTNKLSQPGIDPVGSKGCNCAVSTVRCDARKRPVSRVKRMLTSPARNDVIDPKRSSTRGADLNLLTALKLCKLGPADNHDNEANEYAD
jgi:hypothetical protein